MSESTEKVAFYAKAGESPLRYRRTSRATGLVIEIWDAAHKSTPEQFRSTTAKFTIHCPANSTICSATTWAAAYAISRAIDGQPTPGAAYLGGQFRKLAKTGLIENLRAGS